jgi:hypothetical protein
MDKYARIEGHPNLVRDIHTNAIINTDKKLLDNYNAQRLKKEKEASRINVIESDLNSLKLAIDEIKQLLKDLSK